MKPAAGGAILFLDFDGVLHPKGTTGAKLVHRPLLEAFLREPVCGDVGVVISSTWREAIPLEKLRRLFSADIQPRIVGCTPVLEDTDVDYPRYTEIRAWLNGNPQVKRWAALDDSADEFPDSARMHAVFTDPGVGLDASLIDVLRAVLMR
jgi:hypothetical protein